MRRKFWRARNKDENCLILAIAIPVSRDFYAIALLFLIYRILGIGA